jgi:hypothetical protein
MARGTTAEERAGAISVIPAGFDDVDDVENAFNDFRENLNQSQSPGEVRAFELMVDEKGIIQTTKTQIRLGAWPIDAYTFDELCGMLTRDYMDVGASRMAVRLTASRPGQAGTAFNKIVMLKKRQGASASDAKETTASIMRAIQENNERMLASFRAMIPSRPETDAATELAKIIAISNQLNAPMLTMLQSLLPAIAGRPVAQPDFVGSLDGIVSIAGKLADLTKGGDGGGGGDDDGVAGILRAIVPLAKPVLEAIPALAASLPPRPMPRPAIPGTARVVPPPGSVPTGQPMPAQPPGTVPPAVQPSPNPADLAAMPSGDAQVFAQLKPHIDTLVAMAEQGADPEPAADLLFDSVLSDLPDFMYDKVCSVIEQPNFLQNAAAINPKVTAHKDYFEKFRAQVVKRIQDEDAAAGETPSSAA